ncbi:MAG TPA: ion channel [Candidatus Acidoferrum sp.]|nr:ion channel [Candidatus Acidoferrum sp.]
MLYLLKRVAVALVFAAAAALKMWTLGENPWTAAVVLFAFAFSLGISNFVIASMLRLEPLIALTVLTLSAAVGSLGMVEVVGHHGGSLLAMSPDRVLLNLVATGISIYSVIFAVIIAVRAGFLRASRRKMLARVAAGYIAVVAAFTFGYYVMIAGEDQDQAILMYRNLKAYVETGGDYATRHGSETRSFRGVDKRMWTFVEPDAGTQLANSRQSDFVKFTPNRLEILVDCFHLSVMTMATVGLGDIQPRSMIAKLTMDLQVLLGVVLFVVALGMVLGGWWEKT